MGEHVAGDARQRILGAAECLFAEQGISGTSLRALTRAADVNLAAVHYYFGSKEQLLDAVVERRARPVNDDRLQTLKALVDRTGDARPEIEEILRAFIMPAVNALPIAQAEGQRLARLLARIEAQPPDVVEALSRKHFGEVAARFIETLQRSLPDLPAQLVADRFRFAAGLFSFLFSGNFDLDSIPRHPPRAASLEDKLESMIGFIAAGMRAPKPPSWTPPTTSHHRGSR
jgi:AcrR family transcriptional regulator